MPRCFIFNIFFDKGETEGLDLEERRGKRKFAVSPSTCFSGWNGQRVPRGCLLVLGARIKQSAERRKVKGKVLYGLLQVLHVGNGGREEGEAEAGSLLKSWE